MTEQILRKAHEFAEIYSQCCKAHVGAAIIRGKKCIALEANTTSPHNCKLSGCHRMLVYGENSKSHRLPSDCYAIHAEIKAIAATAIRCETTAGSTIYVTRYPCEACARAIVAAGISKVVYSGIEEISEQTAKIFSNAGVTVEYFPIAWGDDTSD